MSELGQHRPKHNVDVLKTEDRSGSGAYLLTPIGCASA